MTVVNGNGIENTCYWLLFGQTMKIMMSKFVQSDPVSIRYRSGCDPDRYRIDPVSSVEEADQ
jgi:hypothetical protein